MNKEWSMINDQWAMVNNDNDDGDDVDGEWWWS